MQSKIITLGKRLYVTVMMEVIGRAMDAASQEDDVINREIASFPADFIFEMKVINGPGIVLHKTAENRFQYLGTTPPRKPDLSIQFKHLTHAFMVLSFQEGTARSFANDRIVVDGDVSAAIRIVRCLDRLEVLILPKLLAQLGVKQYPRNLSLLAKVTGGARIYRRLALNFAR